MRRVCGRIPRDGRKDQTKAHLTATIIELAEGSESEYVANATNHLTSAQRDPSHSR